MNPQSKVLPRFYYEIDWAKRKRDQYRSDKTPTLCLFDRQTSTEDRMALCYTERDAERIIEALNKMESIRDDTDLRK